MQPRVDSQSALKDYILRQLGHPIVNIELTDDQLDDVIYEALQTFFRVGYGGTEIRSGLLVSQKGVDTYELDYKVDSVLEVVKPDALIGSIGSGNISNPFSTRNIVANEYLKPGILSHGDILTLEIAKEFIATLSVMLDVKVEFDYNTHTKQLHFINETPKEDGITYGLIYYAYPDIDDPRVSNNIYDTLWIKNYATELARRQWARNLQKYAGSKLPNGLELDVNTIKDDANNEITRLLEELKETYQTPPDFFIG